MVEFLTNHSEMFAKRGHIASKDLFEYLVTALHDGYQVSNFYAEALTVQSIFYPKWWLQEVGFFDGADENANSTTPVTPAPTGVVATAKAKIVAVAQTGAVSYFTMIVLIILSGLAGLYFGRKFHGPLTNKNQGYRPLA